MPDESRTVCYDQVLGIEAYHLQGVVQKFPNHFHEYYVIGFIESGGRHLWCGGQEYDISAGDLVLFNPHDCHCCAPVSGEPLDYRAVNIPPDVMCRAAREITGREQPPRFTRNLLPQSELMHALRALYDALVRDAPALEKQEAFYYLLEPLLSGCTLPPAGVEPPPAQNSQIQMLCAYMEQHYADSITLDSLVSMTDFGKSYLLRLFARQVGVSPYRYLQNIRLSRAKELLEQGVPPADAACLTDYADQSHFTHYFKEFIGLTPGQYQKIFTGNDMQKER